MLDLRLWQIAFQAAKPLLENASGVGLGRHGHSAGARKVAQLERELARLKATSLEQLQEEARQQVCNACCHNFGIVSALKLVRPALQRIPEHL